MAEAAWLTKEGRHSQPGVYWGFLHRGAEVCAVPNWPRAKEQHGIFHRASLPWEPRGRAKGLPQRKSMRRIAGSLGVGEQGRQLVVSNQLEQMGRGPPHLQRTVARGSQREGLPDTQNYPVRFNYPPTTYCSQRWRSSIQSTKTRLGTDCGSDHELLIAEFRLTCYSLENFQTWFSVSLSQSEYKPLKGKEHVSVVVCIPGDARLAKLVNSLYSCVSVDGQYINMNFHVMILWPIFCPFLFL